MIARRARRGPLFVWLLASIVALLLAYAVTQLLLTSAGHDQTWYLYAAERYLAGIQLYGPQIVETNPPLIIWFSTIPVAISRLLHIGPYAGFELLLSFMVLGSILWCLRIFRKSDTGLSALSLVYLGSALLVVEFGQFAGSPIGGVTFGQREQLLIILIFPYVIARALRTADGLTLAERCLLGVAAGLGVCFKPQQALILASLELFFVLYTRRLRNLFAPETLAAFLTCVCYVLLLRQLAPRYITQVIPLLQNAYWAVGGISVASILKTYIHFNIYVLLFLLAGFLLFRRVRNRAPAYALLCCAAASFAVYLLQRKGWMYQARPARAFLLFLVFYVLFLFIKPAIDWLDTVLRTRPAAAGSAFAIALILLAVQAVQIRRIMMRPRLIWSLAVPPVDQIVGQLKPGTPVSVLSDSLAVFPTIYRHHLIWASRFPCLWLLPAIVRNEMGSSDPDVVFKRLPPETVASLSDLQRKDTAEDLDSWQPPIVLVEQCDVQHPCAFLEGYDFDMLEWFLKSPRFQSAWSHYTHESDIPGFAVYKRED